MFKANHYRVKKLNHDIYKIKRAKIKAYLAKLSDYEEEVSELSLSILDNLKITSYTGKLVTHDPSTPIQSDEVKLGMLLSNPPQLGDLSLPAFLGKGSLIDKSDQELIKLPKGYLYITRDQETYTLKYHLEKPDDYNPYLDANRTLKDTLPHLVRTNGLVVGQFYLLTRVLSAVKSLIKFI